MSELRVQTPVGMLEVKEGSGTPNFPGIEIRLDGKLIAACEYSLAENRIDVITWKDTSGRVVFHSQPTSREG